MYSCNSRPALALAEGGRGLTAGEGFGGKCNWTNPPSYRMQNAPYRQNTECRTHQTDTM